MKDWESMKLENDTIQVRIETFGILEEFVKDKWVKLRSDSSLFDLSNFMIQKYGRRFKELLADPETNQISSSICFLLNGKAVNNLNKKITNRDKVTLFILVSGG